MFESKIVRILSIINKKAHLTGNFTLKNLIMKGYLTYLVGKELISRLITKQKYTIQVVYQTKSYNFPALFENDLDMYDLIFHNNYDSYYDLVEVLGHHIPVPLVPNFVFKYLAFNIDSDYFDLQ